MMYGQRRHPAMPFWIFVSLSVVAGCADAIAPNRFDPGVPVFVEIGTQPAIRGVGTLGTGTAAAGSNLQEFDFSVAADLTGRFFYRDWRFSATITVDPADPETRITAFRDGAAACAAPANGAEFDAVGRRNNGVLEAFTVRACDDGAAGSGADFLSISTATEYNNSGQLSSGDIIKTVVESAPTTGTISITTSTTGEGQPASYTVAAMGPSFPTGETAAIGANATLTATLTAGDYTVALSGVPSNCTVSGDATRTITVPSGGTGNVAYTVTCTTPPGDLRVTTSSSGSSIPSSYTVTVDGISSKTIASTGSVTFSSISPGSHTVVLTVPSNCIVGAGASRTISVLAGQTATVTYSVSCTTPNQPPVVNAGPDATALVGLLYGITVSFSDPNHNGPWTYTIEWGDGSRTTGTKSTEGTISAGHSYFTLFPRTFTVRVTVVDAAGAAGSDTKNVTVLLL